MEIALAMAPTYAGAGSPALGWAAERRRLTDAGDADAQLAPVDRRELSGLTVAEGNRSGEHFCRQIALVLPRGLEQGVVHTEHELDAVGDLKPGAAARVLDGMDDLPSQALAAQLVVELELERDGVAPLLAELIALERQHLQRHVLGREPVLVPVDVDADLAAALHRGGDMGRVQ